MDKNTLSNYGWIVAVILVLAIMITMATPFASVIKSGVETQVTKFKGTAGNALDNAGNASSFDDLTGGGSGTGGGAGGGSGSAESRSGVIPAGAVYTTAAGVVLKGDDGDNFPETVTEGDIYKEGDYSYAYNLCCDFSGTFLNQGDVLANCYGNGWGVGANDRSKTSYGEILSNINGEPIKGLAYTFADCTNLVTAPSIPSSVENMDGTFYSCSSLTEAPAIPNSVTSMSSTFIDCGSLTEAPAIPNSVTNMDNTFEGCLSLTTAPVIPDGVTRMSRTFYNCPSLTEAPAIPNSVTNMDGAFSCCSSLTTAPTIPNSVTNMDSTFSGCESLTTAPTIPNGVTNMVGTFYGCTSLTGAIEINANPTEYGDCLCETQITEITGSTTLKAEILATK